MGTLNPSAEAIRGEEAGRRTSAAPLPLSLRGFVSSQMPLTRRTNGGRRRSGRRRSAKPHSQQHEAACPKAPAQGRRCWEDEASDGTHAGATHGRSGGRKKAEDSRQQRGKGGCLSCRQGGRRAVKTVTDADGVVAVAWQRQSLLSVLQVQPQALASRASNRARQRGGSEPGRRAGRSLPHMRGSQKPRRGAAAAAARALHAYKSAWSSSGKPGGLA